MQIFLCFYFYFFHVLPGLVEAWTRLQAEFGLLPAIRSLWWGFKPSVSKLCRAGQRHCSTRRPRDGFMVLSPDKAWEERRETREDSGMEWGGRSCAVISRDRGIDEGGWLKREGGEKNRTHQWKRGRWGSVWCDVGWFWGGGGLVCKDILQDWVSLRYSSTLLTERDWGETEQKSHNKKKGRDKQ